MQTHLRVHWHALIIRTRLISEIPVPGWAYFSSSTAAYTAPITVSHQPRHCPRSPVLQKWVVSREVTPLSNYHALSPRIRTNFSVLVGTYCNIPIYTVPTVPFAIIEPDTLPHQYVLLCGELNITLRTAESLHLGRILCGIMLSRHQMIFTGPLDTVRPRIAHSYDFFSSLGYLTIGLLWGSMTGLGLEARQTWLSYRVISQLFNAEVKLWFMGVQVWMEECVSYCPFYFYNAIAKITWFFSSVVMLTRAYISRR